MNCQNLPMRWLVLLALAFAEPAGAARFSSSRSSSSFRSSSSYRSSSSSYRSTANRFGSTRGTGYATLSLLVTSRFSYRASRLSYTRGIIFAPHAWRVSHSDYTEGSTLCFNVMDSLPSEYNSSVIQPWLYQNRTVYGLFVCPMEQGRQDRVYCCGNEDKQVCCGFWEDAGRVAGLIIGLSLGIGCCAFAAYWIHRRCFIRKSGSQVQVAAMTAEAPETLAMPPTVEQPSSSLPATDGAASGGDFGYFNKQPLPPGYTEQLPAGEPAGAPYPTFAPAPPSYWEASGAQHEPLPPVRY